MSVARRLGRYRVGERIGTGGVAEVYRASVEGPGGFAKALVVKCLRPHAAAEPELVESLAREARLAQRLQHGNIAQVFDFGVHEGQPYVVMELVDGCSLHELRRDLDDRGERMGLSEALFVIEELAAALRYAHGLTDDRGVPLSIVHRDVKPRNVLVSRDGVVKLTDFGIAKVADDGSHTLPGVVKGTPAYLAPEQALAREVDARTDLYALGLVIHELLLEADTFEGPPIDPRIDDEFHALVRTATAEKPEDRFEDAHAMLEAIQRWRTTRDIGASPGRLAQWVRRAREQPPRAEPVSLDAALLGGTSGDSTEIATAEATAVDAPTPLRQGWMAVAIAFGLGGVAWASLGDSSEVPAAAVAPTSSADTPRAPATDEATREPEPEETALDPLPSPAASDPEPPSSPAPEAVVEEPAPTTRRPPSPEAEVEPGRLTINLLPWAEVTIDGRKVGRVPIDEQLPPGRHRIVLENPQLGRTEKTIEIESGQPYKITQW